MKGKYNIIIANNKVEFNLVVDRKVTIVKGDSGTGKTTFVEAVRAIFESNGSNKGFKCNCMDKLVRLASDPSWANMLKQYNNKIIVSDEDNSVIDSIEFARAVKTSNNYFILISRSCRFRYLSYSVDNIYGFETKKKNSMFQTTLYELYYNQNLNHSVIPELVITEDSNSGKEMIESLLNCKVQTGNGKDNIVKEVKNALKVYSTIYVVVDGAAFGNCIGGLISLMQLNENKNIVVFAPESFEYFLLNIGRFKTLAGDRLINTQDYADTSKYLTWEQFYTDLLKSLCPTVVKDNYHKSKLSIQLLNTKYKEGIKSQLVDLHQSVFKT